MQVPRVLAHVRNADQDRTQPRADRASDRAGGERPVATAKRYADLMPSRKEARSAEAANWTVRARHCGSLRCPSSFGPSVFTASPHPRRASSLHFSVTPQRFSKRGGVGREIQTC